jgi:hypothetical protein
MATRKGKSASTERSTFIEAISHAYSARGKSVVLLTGDTLDLYWSGKAGQHVPLERALHQEFSTSFSFLRFDIASGVGFYDDEDRRELLRMCALADSSVPEREKLGNVDSLLGQTRHEPLPALELLKALTSSATRMSQVPEHQTKPLCIVVQFAGSLFPPGNFGDLSDLDRGRLVTLLGWITAPEFVQSQNLILLVTDTRASVNAQILAIPSAEQIEIELPTAEERQRFVDEQSKGRWKPRFEIGEAEFVADTAGLKLTSIEDLFEAGRRTRQQITRGAVLKEVNAVLEAELGDIIRVVMPKHGPEDVIGHPATGEILRSVFRRCANPETAVSAVLVSGPNGGGKTFQLEAFAKESGRIVIELTGLRGMYFGQTDTFFERLRWHIKTFGKILILVDEAHTAFGSVHSGDTHPTEQRLAGNIIKMMGNPEFLGQVVWGLMTSRPDELDPDVKSRAPIQVPIFDLEGEPRQQFVEAMFKRKRIELTAEDLSAVFETTTHYSSRDFDFLVREVKASGQPVLEVLRNWSASTSIVGQRRMQSLIASQHCTYRKLLPPWLAERSAEEIAKELETLKWALHR